MDTKTNAKPSKIKMNYTPEQLFEFAETGEYPADVTAELLAKTKMGIVGMTALHIAAYHKNLPKDITEELMINTIDALGNSVLYYAIKYGKLPKTTNLHHLNTPDKNGVTTLETAFELIEHYKNYPKHDTKKYNETLLANLKQALENTNIESHEEFREIAEKLNEYIPT